MASIVHSGLVWDVQSPSFWQLDSRYLITEGQIDLSYLGDGWYLHIVDPGGAVTVRYCADRDEGIAFIVESFRGAGMAI